MKCWIFAIFLMILLVPLAHATVNDGHVVTTVGYVTHEMGTLQDKIPSQTGTKAMTFGDEAGEIGARTVKTDLGTSASDDSLPTVGAVNDKLDDKQDILPAKNTNTVLTYTGVEGSVGEKGIYQNSGTYASQMDSLVTAGTFNAALKNGLDNEFVCAETDPANGQCWAYSINNNGGPWNYFNMDDIPERTTPGQTNIIRNADGSITVTTTPTNSGCTTGKTLKQLAPGLEIGKSYKISINTTGSNKYIYLGAPTSTSWLNGTTRTITADMLNSKVVVYASGVSTSATIYEIKITKVDSGSAVGASGTTILPSGYTPLEYIESTGTQYIDTGIAKTSKVFKVEVDVSFADSTGRYLIGTSSYSPNYCGRANDGKFELNYSMRTEMSSGVDTKVKMEYFGTGTQVGLTVTKNGVSESLIVDYAGSTSSNSFVIFANQNTGVNRVLKGKIYMAKVFINDDLKGDFIPAKRNNDGAIGMYDTVTNTFFTNAGSGTFVAGPEVSNNVYMPQNQ